MATLDAYSRFRDGPVTVWSSSTQGSQPPGVIGPTTVAKLDVPAGLYVIFAKGYAKLKGGGGTKVHCKLIAGADFDHVKVGIDGRDDHRTDEAGFALNVLHEFDKAGTIKLECSCDADDIILHYIKITALHVASYSNLPE
jgi:hypothetical protein